MSFVERAKAMESTKMPAESLAEELIKEIRPKHIGDGIYPAIHINALKKLAAFARECRDSNNPLDKDKLKRLMMELQAKNLFLRAGRNTPVFLNMYTDTENEFAVIDAAKLLKGEIASCSGTLSIMNPSTGANFATVSEVDMTMSDSFHLEKPSNVIGERAPSKPMTAFAQRVQQMQSTT